MAAIKAAQLGLKVKFTEADSTDGLRVQQLRCKLINLKVNMRLIRRCSLCFADSMCGEEPDSGRDVSERRLHPVQSAAAQLASLPHGQTQ